MPDALDHRRLASALEELLLCIPKNGIEAGVLSSHRAKRLVKEINQVIHRLRELAHHIDPVRQPPTILDPYQPEVLGRLIGETMQEQPAHPMKSLHKFYGSGVYALYYVGDHCAYTPISKSSIPIYAGKADPKTSMAPTPEDQGTTLSSRLLHHAKMIQRVANLSIADFNCRFLVVRSGLQKAAEDFLLNYFHPIWNDPICDGFGKHGDSPTTRRNTRS